MPEPTSNINEQFTTSAIPVGLPWRLLVMSLTLFVFSIFIYFGLNLGYKSYLANLDKSLDSKIAGLGEQVNTADQANFINFYSQLVNLKKVIERHLFTGNVFGFLEKNTLGEVYYIDAQYSDDGFSLTLKGLTASSNVLVSQLAIFDKATGVDRVILNQMNADRQGTAFGITLFFNQDFFKKPTL
ncbi:MAG: hypothetical protein AAB617_03190 [Patescibacteria group bacterium]